jgi:hypothetical protein
MPTGIPRAPAAGLMSRRPAPGVSQQTIARPHERRVGAGRQLRDLCRGSGGRARVAARRALSRGRSERDCGLPSARSRPAGTPRERRRPPTSTSQLAPPRGSARGCAPSAVAPPRRLQPAAQDLGGDIEIRRDVLQRLVARPSARDCLAPAIRRIPRLHARHRHSPSGVLRHLIPRGAHGSPPTPYTPGQTHADKPPGQTRPTTQTAYSEIKVRSPQS